MIALLAFALAIWVLANVLIAVCFIYPIGESWVAGGAYRREHTPR
jgi:hypothetical protein